MKDQLMPYQIQKDEEPSVYRETFNITFTRRIDVDIIDTVTSNISREFLILDDVVKTFNRILESFGYSQKVVIRDDTV